MEKTKTENYEESLKSNKTDDNIIRNENKQKLLTTAKNLNNNDVTLNNNLIDGLENNLEYLQCPICEMKCQDKHQFTLHIRSHNESHEENQVQSDEFTCKVCSKTLSSSASLDRHVLVHSGERPFQCKVCSMTFTTNGNMHRHMRIHDDDGANSSSSYDSEENRTTRKRRFDDFNDQPIKRKKRKLGVIIHNSSAHSTDSEESKQSSGDDEKFSCPVCHREFVSLNLCESHLEDTHPEFEIKCEKCNVSFKNYRVLNLHRHMIHFSQDKKKEMIGFKDLSFVDFSSEKFPIIARTVCEQQIHKPNENDLIFKCNNCHLAFPCLSALEIHEKNCESNENSNNSNMSNKESNINDAVKRENFFAHLNLQNNFEKSYKLKDILMKPQENKVGDNNNKDLADIQSILSVTSTTQTLIQHLSTAKHMLSTPPQQEYLQNLNLLTPPDSNSRDNASNSNNNEEEQQDQFAAEFRKMKLRGEFPCRLCTAIFPNLRALKGHNRSHLSGNNVGPYQCNMCPHSSIDKAALIRHMRTHNGDRPYECSICNYAFTTKANCERHLRNRHGKVTREEVKRSIIYHPSEDSTNDEMSILNKALKNDEREAKRSLNFSNTNNYESKTNLLKEHRIIPKNQIKQETNENYPKIHVKSLEELKKSSSENNDEVKINSYPTTPLNHFIPYFKPVIPPVVDYNEDVLDLSKKKRSVTPELDEESDNEEPQDLSTKNNAPTNDTPVISPNNPLNYLLAAQQYLKKLNPDMPPTDNLLFWNQLYRQNSNNTAVPFNLPPILNPYAALFQANPFLTPTASPQDVKEHFQKEFIRGLQLSGGNIIMDQLKNEPFKNYFDVEKQNENLMQNPIGPLQIDTNLNKSPEISSPIQVLKQTKPPTPKTMTESIISANSNSVKMVIKNGVLMPKQKQRRYRTERPFACEHCSARFTLRSNMERHIKQQHPQYWTQRQRSNIGTSTPGRKPSMPPVINLENIYESINKNVQENYTGLKNDNNNNNNNNQNNFSYNNLPFLKTEIKSEYYDKPAVNDNLKYTLLAEQLKILNNSENQKHEESLEVKTENDDEDALIIDENSINDESSRKSLLDDKIFELRQQLELKHQGAKSNEKEDKSDDLVPIAQMINNASAQLPFRDYFQREHEEVEISPSDEDEEGLVAATSEENISGSDSYRSENETNPLSPTYQNKINQFAFPIKSQANVKIQNEIKKTNDEPKPEKKKSAYSLAPNRVTCPYCHRKFPWTSSLRRHILTHTGQKPFKCSHCPLLFTTKSNCDRHLLRKHGNVSQHSQSQNNNSVPPVIYQPNILPHVETTELANNFLTRNVPERPFKCSLCPSSTFSTQINLKKHIESKHLHVENHDDNAIKNYESQSSEDEYNHLRLQQKTENDSSNQPLLANNEGIVIGREVPSSELPFKCHLCDSSFGERQDCLEHIKKQHQNEYEVLMSKGALELSHEPYTSCSSDPSHPTDHSGDDEQLRGKFPDYANRKVMCAFCMRRFWSAEDLRRHMRTHTGERPFSCDICRRRFTLKHSMLRHRKKHNVNEMNSSEEQPDQFKQQHLIRLNHSGFPKETQNDRLHNMALNIDDEVPLNLKKTDSETATNRNELAECKSDDGNDLIGNLLGINDKTIIDQVLLSSADDAAKLLGVNK